MYIHGRGAVYRFSRFSARRMGEVEVGRVIRVMMVSDLHLRSESCRQGPNLRITCFGVCSRRFLQQDSWYIFVEFLFRDRKELGNHVLGEYQYAITTLLFAPIQSQVCPCNAGIQRFIFEECRDTKGHGYVQCLVFVFK